MLTTYVSPWIGHKSMKKGTVLSDDDDSVCHSVFPKTDDFVSVVVREVIYG